MPQIKKSVWTFLILILLGVIVVANSIHIIPAGSIGVITRWGAAQRVAYPGLGLHIPFAENVILMSVRTQKDQVEATAMSKDLQVASSAVAINYHLDGTQAITVYQNIGPDYANVIIAPALQNTFKATTAQYSAEELITHREDVRVQAENDLKAELAKYNVVVENFNIVNFDFSPEFQAAIEQKQVAQQQVETAKQRLNQAQIDAQAEVARAKGQADAQKALKDTGALTQEYLNYLFLTKWNGILPQVMSGGTNTMVDVSKFMGTEPAK
ncbi:MAG: prohibitin family protein [Anaerolineaceae bacterium]|nr:prohibitin family protein [Anaerolineaceae bacterium]